DRVRAACVQFLQNWMVFFYPTRLDIFAEAAETARNLGGELRVPPLSWKYAWIKVLFGLQAAKRAQVLLPRLKWSVIRWWDKVLFRIENRELAGSL
ncbi:MAG: hypothetical protein WB558_13505, partial [Terriglobales bacterium]